MPLQITINMNRRILGIYQLALAKLSKCAQADDHNLLLIVGHLNLLDSLVTRLVDLGDEMQRFDEELTTLKTKEDGCDTICNPVVAIGKRKTPLKRERLLC